MICINLLPWREQKLIKSRNRIIGQLIIAVVLPCLVVGLLAMKQSGAIAENTELLAQYSLINQAVLAKVSRYEQNQAISENQRKKIIQLNKLIDARNKIPSALSGLTRLEFTGGVGYLMIDLERLIIKDLRVSGDKALALFKLLNDHPLFCQVSFAPVDNRQQQNDLSSYEFRARLCDTDA